MSYITHTTYNPLRNPDWADFDRDAFDGTLGLVLHFLHAALKKVSDLSLESRKLSAIADAMDAAYGFGGFHIPVSGAKISNEGFFTYPEDEDLYPLVRISCHMQGLTFTFYQYDHAFIALVEGSTQLICRMD